MDELSMFKGQYIFEEYREGKLVSVKKFDNVLCQRYFTGIFNFLRQSDTSQAAAYLNITHFATGTGTTAPAKADTQLQTEVFRKSVTTRTQTNTTCVIKTTLAPSESNFTIKEVGIFANGTGTANSGNLISHCAVDVIKNSSSQYIVTFTLTSI